MKALILRKKRKKSMWRAKGPAGKPVAGGRGFALVELLIVIIIIGLLAGLLLPVLWRARSSARSAHCKSNLHQLYLALELYRNSNDGTYPHAARLPSLKLNDLPRIADVLAENAPNSRVFKCPSDKAGYFEREGSSYEYNTRLGGQQVLDGRFVDILGETRIPVFFDYEDFHGAGGTPGARNYIYVDGHVEGALAQQDVETEDE